MYLINKKFLLILLLWANFILSAQTKHIKIVQTTDNHGAISPYSLTYKKITDGGLARVVTYLNKERANDEQSVILLSGGDILQGTPEVYYYNFENTSSKHIYSEVMNYMKYDAGAVGNHDIETGHAVYDRFATELNFPWLAANAIDTKTNEPYFKPYTIINKDGIKIAILGLITPGIPKWLPNKIWSGIFFDDMIESAKKWVPIIEEKENPDILIGLFHSGYDPTYGGETPESKYNENASKLVAEQVPGFDVVFVGHDHHGWNKIVKNVDGNEVVVLGGTSSGRDISVANIELEYDSTSGKWNRKIIGELISMKDYSPNEEFLEHFKPMLKEVQEYVAKPLGVFTKKITSSEALLGPSLFTDLINNIQLELTGADISFSAPLSYNAVIDADTVFVSDMFKLYKYENLLYTMTLSGEEIDKYLEFTAANWFNEMHNKNDHLIAFQVDSTGEILYSKRYNSPQTKTSFYNYDAGAGINYTVDVSKPAGDRVEITSLASGESFDLEKEYKVAINSYRGNGGGNHLKKGVGLTKKEIDARVINSTEKDLRYYLMKWIENKKVVTPTLNNNWKIIPENLFYTGKEKDYQILYKK